jgi:hypothetical protein
MYDRKPANCGSISISIEPAVLETNMELVSQREPETGKKAGNAQYT